MGLSLHSTVHYTKHFMNIAYVMAQLHKILLVFSIESIDYSIILSRSSEYLDIILFSYTYIALDWTAVEIFLLFYSTVQFLE